MLAAGPWHYLWFEEINEQSSSNIHNQLSNLSDHLRSRDCDDTLMDVTNTGKDILQALQLDIPTTK